MKILDFKDNKPVISPEIVSISPFKEIWEKDKTKDKSKATDKLKYVWFFVDYNSPYFKYPERDRKDLILGSIVKDKGFKVDKDVLAAIEKFKELNYSPAISAVEAAFGFIHNIEDFFRTTRIEDQKNPKMIQDMFINMPKMVAALNEAKKTAEKDIDDKVKVRGGAKPGMFEN